MRIGIWARVAAAVIVASAVPAMAKKHPAAVAAERHNFVDFDFTAKTPAPLPNAQWETLDLLDSASARREGDTVRFDVLTIGQNFQGARDPVTKTVTYRRWNLAGIENFEASCGWRTVRIAGFETHDDWTSMEAPRNIYLMTAQSRYRAVVDALCAGHMPAAARGLDSVAAAVALWKDKFAAPGDFAMTMVARQVPQSIPLWMQGGAPHQFVAIAQDAATGNRLYLDRANLLRDGDQITALSFVVLGPAARNPQTTALPVAVASHVRVDCAAGTLTVLAQGFWNARRDFLETVDAASAPRTKADSEVTARQIKAACEGGVDSMLSYADTDAAWTAAP